LFEVNGGIIYYEALDQFGIPIVLDSIDPVFVHTTPDDLDCDGVPNAEDFCADSDPINFGPINDWGCDITQIDS
jgi:hypothetical protein